MPALPRVVIADPIDPNAVALLKAEFLQVAANRKHALHECGAGASDNFPVFPPKSEKIIPRRSIRYLEKEVNQGAHAPNTFPSAEHARATIAAIWPLQERDKKMPVGSSFSRAERDSS